MKRWMLAALMTAACAPGLEIAKVKNQDEPGLRFWRPAPYLSLGEKDGACIAQVLWLPDPDAEYRMNPKAGWFGSTEFKPTLQDGWMLTTFDSKSESKLSDLVQAITGLVSAGKAKEAAGGVGPAPATGVFPLGIYRLNLKGGCSPSYTKDPSGSPPPCLVPLFVPNPARACATFAGQQPPAGEAGAKGGDDEPSGTGSPKPGGKRSGK